MILYVNIKEIEPLKEALLNAKPLLEETRRYQLILLDRILKCEQLQKN